MYRVIIDRTAPLRHLRAEWLLTSGLGGFAMGTALGANTRRYHGLLVATMAPPLGRVVALHSVVEQLVTTDGPVDLATPLFELHGAANSNRHASDGDSDDGANALPPAKRCHLLRFEVSPPSRALWVYRVGQVVIEKELVLRPWGNVAELSYCLRHIPGPMTLRLRPLVAMRDYHGLGRESDGPPAVECVGRGAFAMRRHDITLTLEGLGGSSLDRVSEPEWWRKLTYEEDARRGQEHHEDVYSPGLYEARVTRGQADVVILKASAENAQHGWPDPPARSARTPRPAQRADSHADKLRIAADQFIASRLDGETWRTTVLAGFPWFADWGRDTMISLPGLLIASGRLVEAKSVLTLFARHMRRGLVPNRFDDYGGEPEYNTVDASLWFVHAVHALFKADASLIDDALHFACWSVISSYRDGTDFDIRMDDDGLIAAGNRDTQITWMDARRDGIVFTPRNGKAVEIAALWHHALRCAAEMMPDAPERDEFEALAARAAESMRTKFWWSERNCLHDVLVPADGDWRPDNRLRPNQLFAVSLHPSPLTAEQQRGVVNAARQHLLTPFGMRTLEPAHPDYVGRFEGDMPQRDAAYHNGTVWPWLIGPYCEALLRSEDFSSAAKHEARETISPLLATLNTDCLGQVAEVYDGDEPHRADGCPAQAWSVAELLRVLTLLEAGH
jgi:predicted glycogen debranching enzyme